MYRRASSHPRDADAVPAIGIAARDRREGGDPVAEVGGGPNRHVAARGMAREEHRPPAAGGPQPGNDRADHRRKEGQVEIGSVAHLIVPDLATGAALAVGDAVRRLKQQHAEACRHRRLGEADLRLHDRGVGDAILEVMPAAAMQHEQRTLGPRAARTAPQQTPPQPGRLDLGGPPTGACALILLEPGAALGSRACRHQDKRQDRGEGDNGNQARRCRARRVDRGAPDHDGCSPDCAASMTLPPHQVQRLVGRRSRRCLAHRPTVPALSEIPGHRSWPRPPCQVARHIP